MTLQLLSCTICPKLPSFSDTSHLLTHVGSKGHLSHLHKLQVRSHQEVAAGIKLATYNQWYQDHGLGQLLSERMLLKEAKQATRKANAAARGATIQQHDTKSLPPHIQASPARTGTRGQSRLQRNRTRRTRKKEDGDSDQDFTPVKRPRRKHRRTRPPSPVKRALASDPPLSSEVDCPAELDPQDIATPEHAKLKGTVWPGMALFDAATSDMRRKRNQKKDGSVLRKMERLATMVQPFEAVYSPTGELKKARHIDDLEDASSLIEGETPIPKSKQTRARKRLPLAEKNANAPRLVKRKLKTEDSMTVIQRSGNELPSLPYLPSSSTVESYSLGVRFLPSEDEDVDLKPRMSPMVNGRRPATFKIFNDGSPTYNGKGSTAEDGSGLPENLRPQLSASTAPWLQPQQQNALQYTNPYSSQPHLQREYSPFYHHAQHKENIMPSTTPTARLGVHTVNPLSWRSPLRDSHDIGLATESAFENFLGLFPTPTQSDDPFVVTRNPFAQALPHFGVSENMLIKQD